MTKTKEIECFRHGLTTHVIDTTGRYRCRKCRVEYVDKSRKKKRNSLIELFGGTCQSCGYDKCAGALEFHHVDENEKSFELSIPNMTRGWKTLLKEAKKCVLVCSNCHREIHSNVTKCPSRVV